MSNIQVAYKNYVCRVCEKPILIKEKYIYCNNIKFHIDCYDKRRKQLSYRGCLDPVNYGPKFVEELSPYNLSNLDYERRFYRPDVFKFFHRAGNCTIYYKEEDKDIAFIKVINYLKEHNIDFKISEISLPILHKKFESGTPLALKFVFDNLFFNESFNINKFSEYKLRYFNFLSQTYGLNDARFEAINNYVKFLDSGW